ncbi:S41 family peptidase [Enterococcus faecalis]
MSIKKCLLFYIISACVIIFVALTFFFLPLKSIDSRSYEVLHTISQYGVITNKDEWRNILELTRYGRKVTNVDNLNTLVYGANKHSSVKQISSDKDMEDMETLKLPSISKYEDLTIINIPSVYSNDDNFSIKYASKLTDLIENISGNIVLNLSNNYGGLKEPMIIGASSLIPDGMLFSNINNKKEKYPVYLKNGKLFGGIPGTINELNLYKLSLHKKKIGKKVAIVINNNTASVAESLLLALKNNPNVKVFGMPSAGYTSVNLGRFLTNQNSDNYWWFVYTVGYYETIKPIKGQRLFNNQPVPPDYYVDLSMLDRNNQDITQFSNSKKLFKEIKSWINSD